MAWLRKRRINSFKEVCAVVVWPAETIVNHIGKKCLIQRYRRCTNALANFDDRFLTCSETIHLMLRVHDC